jgi:hypothetical protein
MCTDATALVNLCATPIALEKITWTTYDMWLTSCALGGILLFLIGRDEGPYDGGDGRYFQGKEPEGSDKSVQGMNRRGRGQGEGWGVVDGGSVIWEGHVDVCISHDSTQLASYNFKYCFETSSKATMTRFSIQTLSHSRNSSRQ